MQNTLDIAKAPKDTRVVVAMSGGVDSSVVAAMLAQTLPDTGPAALATVPITEPVGTVAAVGMLV